MCTGLEPLFLGMGASAGTAATLATATGALAGASALKSVSGANSAAKAQDRATAQAAAQAKATADAADQAFNKANGKQPNVQGLYNDNVAAGKGGVSGTLLTGPQGIDPKTLLLGKSTLLGA